MSTIANQYRPDYAVPPGWLLAERLEIWDMSQAEFARRCGRSPKLISQIIAGEAPIEPATALQFEKVSGLDATVWLGIESAFQLHRVREMERQRNAERAEWAKQFPIAELVRRGYIRSSESWEEKVSILLAFFGVASVEAWQQKQSSISVAYRHSTAFSSNEAALATWLRLGEISAKEVECSDYNESSFRYALKTIRGMTAAQTRITVSEATSLCQESGVVLVIVKPMPGTALSGIARWLTPRRPLIQLSARHLSDDQLWFSFFHEAAHILLHSKKDIFLHGQKDKITICDQEADQWASDFLIPRSDWEEFLGTPNYSNSNVTTFAERQGIAPGIVVGRLQHENVLPWKSPLNGLKKKLRWSGAKQE
ncbi:MAG: ImmA/IrrE family metallo-endopeptidase [Chloroflexi bacterium]|nr:ImmA/IrrE family metallo-endopeptidase [Chloroflexota bacterium]